MKTPEEIKESMQYGIDESFEIYDDESYCPGDVEVGFISVEDLEAALAYIQQLEAKVPKWISVKDHMPTGEDSVLILVKETEHYGWQKEKWKVYYCQYMAYWDGDEWFTTWCNGCRKISDTAKEPYADDYEVTHWMPLPEPPEV